MKILALYAGYNSVGKNDATGAFIPESIHFEKYREKAGDVVDRIAFDNTIKDKPSRKARFLEKIETAPQAKYDAVAYFGHGLRTGLSSASIGNLDVGMVATVLSDKLEKDCRIILYACSTAGAPGSDRNKLEGDGGFADRLRDVLSIAGHTGWVDAHTVPGHTTINRMCRRFYMDGESPGTGGTWLVAPGSSEWKAWGEYLNANRDFRYGFPFMTEKQIHDLLPG